MAKFMVEILVQEYLGIVLDWYTKKIVECSFSLRSRFSEWETSSQYGAKQSDS